MIFEQVHIVLDLAIHTKDKPREINEEFRSYLGVTVIPFKLEPVMLVIFINCLLY